MLSHELMRAAQELWAAKVNPLFIEMQRRGRIAGRFHRRPKAPLRAGHLLACWKHGVRLGNDDRDELKEPPPKPPTNGGRRIRYVA